jgi:class 3 adenylate cyclase
MEEPNLGERSASTTSTGIRTFLIADLRGYTRFTDEHGDEAAAQLTAAFLALAREAVSSRSGDIVEVRGDEVLAVFDSPREAIRAALDLSTAAEGGSSPELPMLVGIGLDAGEAVPVEGGYRGYSFGLFPDARSRDLPCAMRLLRLSARVVRRAGDEALANREVQDVFDVGPLVVPHVIQLLG